MTNASYSIVMVEEGSQNLYLLQVLVSALQVLESKKRKALEMHKYEEAGKVTRISCHCRELYDFVAVIRFLVTACIFIICPRDVIHRYTSA